MCVSRSRVQSAGVDKYFCFIYIRFLESQYHLIFTLSHRNEYVSLVNIIRASKFVSTYGVS
jgi:hypothetical protein